ncbi:hypothetical protein [Liberiplasma polymorphum]|uniref:hypothetical protein n=1 Tax=Liberiplasma polymorphum TaxID=3374570 RepID=UPI0037759E21
MKLTVEEISIRKDRVSKLFDDLVKVIPNIPILTMSHLPLGLGNISTAKGFSFLLKEVIIQNLVFSKDKLEIFKLNYSKDAKQPYDLEIQFEDHVDVFIKLKFANISGKPNKDGITRSNKLIRFLNDKENSCLFVVTFHLKFFESNSISLKNIVVMPIDWIADIYVTPNKTSYMQSTYYRFNEKAIKRSRHTFLIEFEKVLSKRN